MQGKEKYEVKNRKLQIMVGETSFSRSSCSQTILKIRVLKNFAVFTGKRLCWSLFLMRLQASVPKVECSSIQVLWVPKCPSNAWLPQVSKCTSALSARVPLECLKCIECSGALEVSFECSSALWVSLDWPLSALPVKTKSAKFLEMDSFIVL